MAFRFLFSAQDYPATVTFYTQTLGLPVVESWEDDNEAGTIVQAFGDGQVEMFRHQGAGAAPRVSGAAIAWQIEGVDAEIERLRSAGVPVITEPADQPWGHRNATIEDPNGIRITLFQVL